MDTLLPEDLTEYATEYGIAADVAQRDYVAVRVAHARGDVRAAVQTSSTRRRMAAWQVISIDGGI
jgi:hypothetical protein